MSIIFYGIPSINNVSRNISNWIDVAGVPDVFSEKDENLENYKTKLLGKYDVIPFDEALERYPDADVWVTYRKAGITAKMLLTKLPPEKIHFLEADLEYRKGCRYLGHFISYRNDNFSPCCVAGMNPVVKTSGSVAERLIHWQKYTTNLIDDIRNNKPNDCSKCPLLTENFWHKNIRLDTVAFGSNNPGDVCNFKCIYCFSEQQLDKLKMDTEGYTTYDILKQLSELPEYNIKDFTIQLSNGEFSANKKCDDILEILLNTKWKIQLVTNLSIYRERLEHVMETGRVMQTLVSLDAGTRETFKKIKQVDAWDKVINNLKRYPIAKANIILKYIFLEGYNDNIADIDGFYEVVKEVGCKRISLSSNQKLNYEPLTPKMRELVLRLIKKAKIDGITFGSTSYLNPDDTKWVNEMYEKENGNPDLLNPIKIGFLGIEKNAGPKSRYLSALSNLYDIEFFYFNPERIDTDRKIINGLFFDKKTKSFIEKETTYPHIIDEIPSFRVQYPKLFNELLNYSLFLYTPLKGKRTTYSILGKSKYSKYMIETYNYKNIDINELLIKHKSLILKPNRSNGGQNVYKLHKENEYYHVHFGKNTEKLSEQEFQSKYNQMFIDKDYLVQNYINSTTTQGNPFDIRVNARRGKNGAWTLKTIFVRIGNSGTLVSNISNGGSIGYYVEKFLMSEFGDECKKIYDELVDISKVMPDEMQKGYNYMLDDIGFDVGINRDNNNELKFFEINTGTDPITFKIEALEARFYYYLYMYDNFEKLHEVQKQEFSKK